MDTLMLMHIQYHCTGVTEASKLSITKYWYNTNVHQNTYFYNLFKGTVCDMLSLVPELSNCDWFVTQAGYQPFLFIYLFFV